MAAVFGEEVRPLSDAYLDDLLGRPGFWAVAAFDGDGIVGGLTAHTLPMTTSESAETFIYDLAVLLAQQRRGIGRQLVATLRHLAAAAVVFVPADNDVVHALDFYRAIGGAAAPVTHLHLRSRRRLNHQPRIGYTSGRPAARSAPYDRPVRRPLPRGAGRCRRRPHDDAGCRQRAGSGDIRGD